MPEPLRVAGDVETAARADAGWLLAAAVRQAVPRETSAAPRIPHLTAEHKRELAQITGAVIASGVFFLMPLMYEPGGGRMIPARAFEVQYAVAPVAHTGDVPATTPATLPRVTRRRVPRERATLLASRAGLASVVTTREARVVQLARPREASPHIVVRALIGNGRHKVRPFPVPGAEN